MFSSKKKRAIKHLESIQSGLDTVIDYQEFNIWKRSALGAIRTYTPGHSDVITAFEGLLTFKPGSGFIKTRLEEKPRPKVGFTNEEVATAKGIATRHITNLIEHIKVNGIEADKGSAGSFWEKTFDAKTLLGTIAAFLAIIVTLIVVGLPNAYRSGFDTAKSNTEAARQREVDKLNDKVDSLNQKIQELRDSIPKPKPKPKPG